MLNEMESLDPPVLLPEDIGCRGSVYPYQLELASGEGGEGSAAGDGGPAEGC